MDFCAIFDRHGRPMGASVNYLSDRKSVSYDLFRSRADGTGMPELVINLAKPVLEAQQSSDGKMDRDARRADSPDSPAADETLLACEPAAIPRRSRSSHRTSSIPKSWHCRPTANGSRTNRRNRERKRCTSDHSRM